MDRGFYYLLEPITYQLYLHTFRYKAIQSNGKMIEQSIQARDRDEVITSLRSKKFRIIFVKQEARTSALTGNKVSNLEKANFCRYMAVMLKAGLSISESIDIISSETENKKMKLILQALSFELQEGSEISTVLSKYPEVFDQVFLALVKAGEQSGSLEKTFSYLSDQLYAVHRLNKKISGAMMYPMVIITAMFGVGFLMMTFVLPRLSQTFLKMKIPLPLPTRILLETGKFIGDHVLLVMLGAGLLIGLFMFLFGYHKTRQFIMSRVANLPLIKNLFRQIDLARFTRTLAALLQSGVSIVSALQISSKTLSQYDMQKMATQFEKGVSEGKTIADVLSSGQKRVFPSLMVQTIKTGEKTGTLDTVLLDLSEYYEAELEDKLKEFTTILEPIIMLVIGVAVGAMVIMIIAPIYSVMGQLQGPSKGMGVK